MGRLRRKRSSKEPLWKTLYLTDAEYLGRLFDSSDNEPIETKLDDLYARVREMRPEIMSAFNVYLVSFSALFLSRFHLLSSIDAPGMKIASDGVQHVLLFACAYFQFRLSYLYCRHSYVTSIFERQFKKSSPSKRSMLLAEYPFAYLVSNYYPTSIGALPLTFKASYPVRTLAALLFTVVGLLFYLSLSTWLFISVGVSLASASTPIPALVSKGLVVAAFALIIAGWLLPSSLPVRRRYTHGGLVTLMTNLHQSNHARWLHFVPKIDQAQRNLGLKK